jgi:flavin-dependent dehydrogenase
VTTAVVLGGGFAGALAAAVLARHARVTVVEGDAFPAGPTARPGQPQAHHNHVLLGEGAAALEALLPGTTHDLLDAGARRLGLTGDALVLGPAGWFLRHETGTTVISATRWLLDNVVRRRALTGDIEVRQRTRVLGLTGDAARVTGAVVQPADASGRAQEIAADIIIDATGRRSQAPRWLAALGAAQVTEQTIDSGVAYATRSYRAPADLADAIPAIMIHPSPAPGRPDHGATLFPVEDGRWLVTLTGTRDSAPPTGEAGFAAFARSLRTPLVADLIHAATPAGPVRPYRATANTRRLFHEAALPAGFLAIGDAVMTVNPVFSHGLSVASLSVAQLAGELARQGATPAITRQAQAAIAAVAQRSWYLAVGRLTRAPVAGHAPAQAQARDRMLRALPGSPVLLTEFFRAQALTPMPPPPAGALAAELAGPAAPRLSADEAIAQYPGLHQWWHSTHRRPILAYADLTGTRRVPC